MTPFSSHSPLPCLFLVVQSFWKNLAWSACSSCSLNLFSCVSCPLIFEPCHFFVYHPLTDSCFLTAFLFGALPDVSFWESFISQRQKHIPFSYLFFAWGSSTLIIFHLVSCPLILEPCLFFVYRPLTDSCFLITFLFRTGPDVSFWIFSKPKTKNKIQIHFLICFSPGALRN